MYEIKPIHMQADQMHFLHFLAYSLTHISDKIKLFASCLLVNLISTTQPKNNLPESSSLIRGVTIEDSKYLSNGQAP